MAGNVGVRAARSPTSSDLAYVRALAGAVASPGFTIRVHGNAAVALFTSGRGG